MRFLQFFGLKFNPFRKDVPIEQLFNSETNIELRSRLEYLQATKGIGLVVGEPGTGKTTALRAYLKQLNPASYQTCYFALSTLNVREFLSGLAIELGGKPGPPKGEDDPPDKKCHNKYAWGKEGYTGHSPR